MPIGVGHLVTTAFSRDLSFVFSGDGAVSPFKAYTLTGTAEAGQWEFLAADGGNSVFGVLGVATPAGFSPFGDLVLFRSISLSATQFNPVSANPLTTDVVVQAIIFGWVEFEDFAGTTFAFMTIPQPGGGDRFVVALPAELSMIRKNPAFP